LLGSNGFGKTTILQALTLTILNDKSIDIKPIEFEPFIRIGKQVSEFKVVWNDELFRQSFLYPTEKKTQNGSCVANLLLLAYGSNTFTRYNNMNYTEMVEKIINGDSKMHHTSSLFKDSDDNFFDPLYIFNDLERFEFQNQSKRTEIKEIKDTLLEKLNSLIPNDIEIRINGLSYYFYSPKGEKLKLNQLSEGYRTAILMLNDILMRIMSLRSEIQKYIPETTPQNIFDKAFGIIAIDEFDRHLHPTWQLVYINNLQRVLPNMQLVLTTHNPLSILDRNEDEVLQLIVDEDTHNLKVKKYAGGTKLMDAEMVLLNYFGVDYVISPSLNEKIDRYYWLLSQNKVENEEFKHLEEELKNLPLGIKIPDYNYLKFYQFVKKRGINLRQSENQNKLDFSEKSWDELANELF